MSYGLNKNGESWLRQKSACAVPLAGYNVPSEQMNLLLNPQEYHGHATFSTIFKDR